MTLQHRSDIFALALGLRAPWSVTRTEILPAAGDERRSEVHISVDWQEGSSFPCPVCGKECSVHDSSEYAWRHPNFFEHRCYIHARLPKVSCPTHGVQTVTVPWQKADSGFTFLQ